MLVIIRFRGEGLKLVQLHDFHMIQPLYKGADLLQSPSFKRSDLIIGIPIVTVIESLQINSRAKDPQIKKSLHHRVLDLSGCDTLMKASSDRIRHRVA